MTYNIHPIFVHFPVAMLLVYSIIKVLPFKKWFPQFAWRDVERVLLVVGVLGAFAALTTGETAEHLMRPNHQLVEMHSTFGTLSAWIYGALLLGEIAAVVKARMVALGKDMQGALAKLVVFLDTILCHRIFSGVLALVGLVAISVTGLLGGVLAYGLTADPFAATVVKLLGIQL